MDREKSQCCVAPRHYPPGAERLWRPTITDVGPILKSEASQDFVESLQKVEDRADSCCESLALFAYPSNLGCWGILSRMILQIEETIERHGHRSQAQSSVTFNLGRGGAQALAWVMKLGAPPSASRGDFQITSGLLQSSSSALWIALAYETCTATFPLWHKNELRA